MKPSLFLVLAVLAMARGMPAIADDTRIGVTPDEIQWGQVEGLGLAVILQGDPAKSCSYILRIKVPPNNITQPHVHQQAENRIARSRRGEEHRLPMPWLADLTTRSSQQPRQLSAEGEIAMSGPHGVGRRM